MEDVKTILYHIYLMFDLAERKDNRHYIDHDINTNVINMLLGKLASCTMPEHVNNLRSCSKYR